jgi:hypothetical protein
LRVAVRMKALMALVILLLQGAVSFAQHNHAQGHADYSLWASRKTENCCNNQDCGELQSDEWRETNEGTEVKILGQWCPVMPEHLIIRGKSPDWSKPHACINNSPSVTTTPCLRLLCFSGIPKS